MAGFTARIRLLRARTGGLQPVSPPFGDPLVVASWGAYDSRARAVNASKRTPPPTEEITTSRYDVEVRVVDAAGAELCQRLRDTLPPEFAAVAGAASVVVSYLVTVGTQPVTAEHPGYRVSRDGSAVFAAATEEDVFAWLCQDIDNAVAQRSRGRCSSCTRA